MLGNISGFQVQWYLPILTFGKIFSLEHFAFHKRNIVFYILPRRLSAFSK